MTAAMRAVKTDRGVKRRCNACAAPFYDLLRSPIVCPKCGVAFNANARSASGNPAKRFKASVSRTKARLTAVPDVKAEENKRPKKSDETEDDEDTSREDLILDPDDDDED